MKHFLICLFTAAVTMIVLDIKDLKEYITFLNEQTMQIKNQLEKIQSDTTITIILKEANNEQDTIPAAQ